MRLLLGVMLGLMAVGCEIQKSPEDARKEREAAFEKDYWEKRHAQEAARAQERSEHAKAQAIIQAQHEAFSADAAQKTKTEDHDKMCADTRAERIAEMTKRLESIRHKAELQAWEGAHCKWVDNAKAVVRVLQDSRGEYHTVEGNDRGVDRVCDAKPPADMPSDVRFVQVYSIPVGRIADSVRDCRSEDLDRPETAELARGYWKEACAGWGRNGKTPPAWCEQFKN